MNIEDLLAGIAVVIDDKIEPHSAGQDDGGNEDLIVEIVRRIEEEWHLPFYRTVEMPPEETWPKLLQAASFVLLDWRLWPHGASQLEKAGIEKNIRFLQRAKECFVPVLIFTNEAPEDVEDKLPEEVYRKERPEENFVFIRQKVDLFANGPLDFSAIENWVQQNASVYTLKTWEQAFFAAKAELFSAMYSRSPDWPRVFWKAYKDDGVDPSSSLTHLVNDCLRGRMRTNLFEEDVLSASSTAAGGEDLRALIGETSFRPAKSLPEDEIGCGDVFRLPKKKFLLNIRPDCDCVPRNGEEADEMELYCIEGEKMSDNKVREEYKGGHFEERVWESVAFSIYEGKSVRFSFRELRVKKFSELKDKRVGRLLHPYLTRIQQRYALYLQRQGLPRIPREAILP